MAKPEVLAKGGLLKSLTYTKEPGVDVHQCVIVIRDLRGVDTEYNGYGQTYEDAMLKLFRAGYEIVIEKPEIAGYKVERKTFLKQTSRIPARGFAIKRMMFVVEKISPGKFSFSAKHAEFDAAERVLYGRTFEDVVIEAYKEGYEIVQSTGVAGNGKHKRWETIRAGK